MPKFIYAFHGGKPMPQDPQQLSELMAKWGAWMAGLGTAMINPGAPVGMSKTVSLSGVTADGGANPLSGFTIIQADNMETALKAANGCPILDNEGTIEVAEMIEM